MDSIAIKVEKLAYQYPAAKRWVIKDLNLSLARGEFLVLAGLSGSGKSTLLTLLRGMHQEIGGKLRGHIEILRQDVRRVSVNRLGRTVGIVFQNPALQLHQLRVIDEVASAPMYQGVPYSECISRAKKLVDELLGESFYNLHPSELSSGQQQKVALAASLSLDPEVLLLDEPFSFLDETADGLLLEILEDLHKKGKTIVVATHDVGQIASCATQMAVMRDGKFVLMGSPAKVLFSNAYSSIMPPPLAVRVANKTRTKTESLSWDKLTAQIEIKKLSVEKKPTQKKSVFSLNKVSFSYPGAMRGIKNVQLTIGRGEIVAIIGANGSGKTTLAKVILGLVRPKTGRVILEGKDITRQPTEKRAKAIGFVTQDPLDMFFETTLWDEVAAGPRFLGLSKPKEKARNVLRQFNLWQYKGKHPDSISGGEKSRLGIADIVVNNTKVLILDEPEFGLDPKSWEEIVGSLEQLRGVGKSLIVITQDLEAALFLADRVCLMEGGELVKTGTAIEIFKNEKLLLSAGLTPLPFAELLKHFPDKIRLTKKVFLESLEGTE